MSHEAAAARVARDRIKTAIYRMAKYGGLFRLCRHRTRACLRILCYHGIWSAPAPHFGDALFMSAPTFAGRMRQIEALGYPVLDLGDAVRRQDAGDLPAGALVITIDDGFYTTFEHMLPVLASHDFPSTVYVTTHAATKGTAIASLLMRYVLETGPARSIDLGALQIGLAGVELLGSPRSRATIASTINSAIAHLDNDARIATCIRVAHAVGLDLEPVMASRQFEIMSLEEIAEAAANGVDVQLHTHRHRTTLHGKSVLEMELEDNREILARLVTRPLEHFCYPSGIHAEADLPILEAAGVVTATTCLLGFNDRDTPRLQLRRILDAQSISALEFEAELCGFGELLRETRRRIGTLARRWPLSAPGR